MHLLTTCERYPGALVPKQEPSAHPAQGKRLQPTGSGGLHSLAVAGTSRELPGPSQPALSSWSLGSGSSGSLPPKLCGSCLPGAVSAPGVHFSTGEEKWETELELQNQGEGMGDPDSKPVHSVRISLEPHTEEWLLTSSQNMSKPPPSRGCCACLPGSFENHLSSLCPHHLWGLHPRLA